MSTTKVNCLFPELKAARDEAEFRLHNQAVEWGLAKPIMIQSSEDVKSSVHWKDRVEPFHHQMQNLMTFCRRLPVSLVADDVGLGKTISAGLILSELMTRGRVSRALVIAPKILGEQWVDELSVKFGISAVCATGGELDGKIDGTDDVVVTTYHSASKRLRALRSGTFDMMILDEAHKVRNLHGAQSAPQMAENIRHALSKRLFKYVLMLTATPIQNRLWDLYSLVDCLAVAKGQQNPFGSPSQFDINFIADRAGRELRPDSKEQFHTILRQYLVRTRRQDVRLLFPGRDVRLFRVQPRAIDSKIYELVLAQIDGLNGLVQSSVLQAMMSSPEALALQCRNSSQHQLHSIADVIADQLGRNQPAKLKGLLQIVEELRSKNPKDWRAVVFTRRQATQDAICTALDEAGVSYGRIEGGKPRQNRQTVIDYSETIPRAHVIVSTDTGAEGLNLQAGNVLVNYDLPWNPMTVEQRIGRVQRLASKFKNVVIVNLVVARGPDDKVVARLVEKLQVISQSIGDIEAVLQSTSTSTSDEASSDSFEDSVRDMVVRSLKGQDVKEDARLKVKSIEEAKALFEEQREQLDQQLGDLDELHHTGPAMPALTDIDPSISFREFVESTFEYDGFELEETAKHSIEARKGSRTRQTLVFCPNEFRERRNRVLDFNPADLYLPGKPAFERLSQKWRNRAGHDTRDLTVLTLELAEELAKQWLKKIPNSQFEAVAISQIKEHYQGTLRLKAVAATGLDSYEKLIETRVAPPEHGEVEVNCGRRSGELLSVEKKVSALKKQVVEACGQDEDIEAFCAFYEQRLDEELSLSDGASNKRLENDLSANVQAELVSADGQIYETCTLDIAYRLYGHTGYSSVLKGCPATGQITQEPTDWIECSQTGDRVPVSCTSTCAISKQTALKHLLIRSEDSNRLGLEKHTIRCEVSGKRVLEDELRVSEVSGIKAIASLFHESEVSKRIGLSTETATCGFTNVQLLIDEAAISEVSGLKYRIDEQQKSAVSATTGHQSEFVQCSATLDFVLQQETTESEVSHQPVRSDKLVTSQASGRIGGMHEAATCDVTGQLLLSDEIETCEETEKRAAISLLAMCDESGKTVIAELLEVCAETGKRALPSEFLTSDISSRRAVASAFEMSEMSSRRGLVDELAVCHFTETRVLTDELEKSEVSGHRYRKDQTAVSTVSHVSGHKNEFEKLESYEGHFLPQEIATSSVSGRRISVDQVVKSEKDPSRVGAPDEAAICEKTGRTLLVDEVGACEASSAVVALELLGKSDVSGLTVTAEMLEECSETGQRALPSEFGKSDLSDRHAVPAAFDTSAMSERRGLPDEMGRCEFTEIIALTDELKISDVSGKQYRADEEARSATSHKVGHVSEFQSVPGFEGDFLSDELRKSDVSGATVPEDQMIVSAKTQRIGTPEEKSECEVSGLVLLADEVGRCVVSGKAVDLEILHPSDHSGNLAQRSLMIECRDTDQLLLPKEVVALQDGTRVAKDICVHDKKRDVWCRRVDCDICSFSREWMPKIDLVLSHVSNRLLKKDDAVVSDLTERIGHIDESCRCDYSARILLSDEVAKSDYSKKWTATEDLVRSASCRQGVASEFTECEESGEWLLLDEVDTSAVSGLTVKRDLLVKSKVSDRWALPRELVCCDISKAMLLPDETGKCSGSGLTVDRNLLFKSDMTGEPGLQRELAKCPVTKMQVLRAELETCAISGLRIASSEIVTCAISQQRCQKNFCSKSGFSDRWALQDYANPSAISGKPVLRDEQVRCHCSHAVMAKQEASVCKRTGLEVMKEFLGQDGVLTVVTNLMSRQLEGKLLADSDLLRMLRKGRSLIPFKVSKVWYTCSKKDRNIFICAESPKLLGLQKDLYSLVIRNVTKKNPAYKLIGHITRNLGADRGWETVGEDSDRGA